MDYFTDEFALESFPGATAIELYTGGDFNTHFSIYGDAPGDIKDLFFVYHGRNLSRRFWIRRSEDYGERYANNEQLGIVVIHPMLYIPVISYRNWYLDNHWSLLLNKAHQYTFGTWALYLAFFPLLPELKQKIYYILGYLMFFHSTLKIVVPNLKEMKDQLTPLYQLTQR